jgi:transcriptional regulator with XRE-family HTH domain
MDNTPETFGARVSALHAELNTDDTKITCNEIDRAAGLTRGHTWQIEEGAAAIARGDSSPWEGTATNPKADTVRKLAKVFGCSVGYLLEGEGERPAPEAVRAAYANAVAASPSVPSTRRDRSAA